MPYNYAPPATPTFTKRGGCFQGLYSLRGKVGEGGTEGKLKECSFDEVCSEIFL